MCITQVLTAKENPSIAYISQFKEIAITEMQRTGIPASIKMAQALLESGAGRSTLAIKANNHFGIKCGGEWNGKTFYRKDDDYNDKGKLIESCFRKFNSSDESFIAHSNFLSNQKRYSFLFDFDKNDYHKWAYGLKKAGYATDAAYPNKLIKLIEKYQLFLLDSENTIVAEYDVQKKKSPFPSAEMELPAQKKVTKNSTNYKENNNSAKGSKSRSSKRKDSKNSKTKSNTRSSSRDSKRKHQSRSGRSSSKKISAVFHIVKEGETISEIAKRYGLKEGSVRLRNRLPRNAEPVAGEKIFLKKKIRLLDQPIFSKSNRKRSQARNSKFIF